MFAHERSLVQKYAGQPFVLLGVNGDESPFELQRIQNKEGLTWRSFWDGKNGAIAANWGVDGFPTFFLIDREGVVRWRHVGVPARGEIEKKIDELLKTTDKT
jgi:peroxiredoxin